MTPSGPASAGPTPPWPCALRPNPKPDRPSPCLSRYCDGCSTNRTNRLRSTGLNAPGLPDALAPSAAGAPLKSCPIRTARSPFPLSVGATGFSSGSAWRGWRGFARLYGLLKPAGGRRALRASTRYGSQFFLEPFDNVDSHVLAEGFYESEVLEAVRPVLGRGAVLWVVGANFGLHAVTASSAPGGGRGRIRALARVGCPAH